MNYYINIQIIKNYVKLQLFASFYSLKAILTVINHKKKNFLSIHAYKNIK